MTQAFTEEQCFIDAEAAGKPIRLFGRGAWYRDDDGWHLIEFKVHEIRELNDAPLNEVVEELRGVMAKHG